MTAQLDISEKAWQADVVKLARTFGWSIFHTYDSRRSNPGLPDLILVRDRIVWAELKRQSGKLSLAQQLWIAALEVAGAEVYVWKPSDLESVGRVLTSRERVAA